MGIRSEGQYKEKWAVSCTRGSLTLQGNLFLSHFFLSPDRRRPQPSSLRHVGGSGLSVRIAGTSGAGGQFFGLCCFLHDLILFFPALHRPPCLALTHGRDRGLPTAGWHWLVLVVCESGGSESSRSLGGRPWAISCCAPDPRSRWGCSLLP